MMPKHHRCWSALALALAACAAPGPPLLGTDAAPAAAAIAAAWQGHITGARQNDLAAVVALYADDAVYVIDGQPPVRGKQALEAMESHGMATGTVLAAHHATEALRVDRDLAYELGSVVGDVQPNGQPAQRVVFHYVALWRVCSDGHWHIAHLVGQVEAETPPTGNSNTARDP